MTRVPWKPGPDAGWDGPVYVSVTDFAVDRARDLPAVWTAGLRLRRAWPRMQGAVGLWLWAIPTQRRGGSVSVWRSEEDLMRFVRSPVHVAIMRANRDKGSLRSENWESPCFAPQTAWAQASDLVLRSAS
ncbi:MAG: hypothetical protein QOJ97_2242 [Solirubrobacteraceae bacterium]|nr:hypothetical protein [Solirubrobacteraceae bacterium]